MDLKKYCSLILGLLFCCGLLHAQDTHITELLKMPKADSVQIDTMMSNRGYKKSTLRIKGESDEIVTYKFVQGTAVTRMLNIARRAASRFPEVYYGVWQKDEADAILSEMSAYGFKKVEGKNQDSRNQDATAANANIAEYKKGEYTIRYREGTKEGSVQMIYAFEIVLNK